MTAVRRLRGTADEFCRPAPEKPIRLYDLRITPQYNPRDVRL